MHLKPISLRTNWPIIAAFVVWILGIMAMGVSHTLYYVLSAVAFALFLCQIAVNVAWRPRGRA